VPLTNDDIARLYRLHAESVLGYFARRTYQPDVAVDLMAETFAAAFEDRADFAGEGDDRALAWIYGIAHHRLASFFRRGEVEQRALRRLGVQRRPLEDWEYDRIEQLAGLSQMREQIDVSLADLGVDQREAIKLRVLEERSYPEVARALGISEQTARARVSRALRTLRTSSALTDLQESPDHA
jgi:RNA polymerase sigma factor (sigma-70 family)